MPGNMHEHVPELSFRGHARNPAPEFLGRGSLGGEIGRKPIHVVRIRVVRIPGSRNSRASLLIHVNWI